MFESPESTRVVTLMLTWACNLNCTYCFEKFKTSGREMSVETAMNILSHEFDMMRGMDKPGKLKVEFFGGEPLLKFDVIKEITEWIEANDPGVEYLLSVTSNGTLLDDAKKEWFTRHKDRIRIVMSVDGSEEMQRTNRGYKAGEVPLDFVRRTWPELHFKSTISRANLPGLADGIIYLLEQGHVVAPNLAQGEDWQPGDEIVYKRELEKLADWQLAHPDIEPMNFFNQPFFALLEPHCLRPPRKNCGTGTTMATYDVDGKCYPCHLFVPITHGRKDAAEDIAKIDFYDDASLIDDSCKECGILRICKTCYGFDFKDRGSVKKRDKRACRMKLAEAQVISDFQINWLMMKQKRRPLTPIELFGLKGAVKCHQMFSNFKF